MHYDIEHAFSRPNGTPDKLQPILDAAKALANAIQEHAPFSADRDSAIEHVRQAAMLAEAAITLNGLLDTGEVLIADLNRLVLQPAYATDSLVYDIVMSVDLYTLFRKYAGKDHLEIEHRATQLKLGLQARLVDAGIPDMRLWASREVPPGHAVAVPDLKQDRGAFSFPEDALIPFPDITGLTPVKVR